MYGQDMDFDVFKDPSEMRSASDLVIVGEIIGSEPGLQVRRKNTIPEGYEPDQITPPDAEGFPKDPDADEPPDRTLPEESVWLPHIALHVRVENSLTDHADPGDVVTVHVVSGRAAVDEESDVDFSGPVFVAGSSLPLEWEDDEMLVLDWNGLDPAPLADSFSPWQDGLWFGTDDGIVGLHGLRLPESFGNPESVDQLFSALQSSGTQ